MKKFFSVLLVVALVFSFSVSVFAAGGAQPSGSNYPGQTLNPDGSRVLSLSDYWTATAKSISTLVDITDMSRLFSQLTYNALYLDDSTTSVADLLSSISTHTSSIYQYASYLPNIKNSVALISTTNRTLSSISDKSDTISTKLDTMSALLTAIANNGGVGGGGSVTFPNYIQIDPWLDSGQWNAPGETGYNPDSWWYKMHFNSLGTYAEVMNIKDIESDNAASNQITADSTSELLNVLYYLTVADKYSALWDSYLAEESVFGTLVGLDRERNLTVATGNPHSHWSYSDYQQYFTTLDILANMNNNDFVYASHVFSPNKVYDVSIKDYSNDRTTSIDAYSIADLISEYGHPLADGVNRLEYVLADDDTIALKKAQQDNVHALQTDFLSGQDSPTSIGLGSIGAVKGFGDSLHDIFSVGSVSPGSFLTILSVSDPWAFFSAQTKTDIGMNGSQRRMMKASAFSDLDSSGTSVEVTNYYQQNIDVIHEYLEVMSDD